MSNFDQNAILRGAQLTLVGAYRALQNPALFTSDHYRQAALAVAAGVAISLLLAIPTFAAKFVLWTLSAVVDLRSAQWDDAILNGLHFLEHSVLQVPFFLMTMMRHMSPALDNMFMVSLEWVDQTYSQKHSSQDPSQLRAMYYPNLIAYPAHGPSTTKSDPLDAASKTLMRYGRKAGISLAVLGSSYIPYVGRLVLPAASFYTFRRAVGTPPAVAIFGAGIFLPRWYLVTFLQSYFASRSLMRELLVPYFARVHFTPEQKRTWFRDREGVLFGFALGFFLFLKLPIVGVLIYGIAEASTAFLITKITDPPPAAAKAESFAASQVHWRNKHEFLKLPLDKLDSLNLLAHDTTSDDVKQPSTISGKQFS